ISSRFVSQSRYKCSEKVPIRFARSLICFPDSSPEMYSTFFPASERRWHTCKSSVDFPIPGSPPTSTREPCTIPPPSTRSSSAIPVLILSSSSTDTLESVTTLEALSFPASEAALVLPLDTVTFSSTNVFHSLQAGHCPNHLLSSCPQF